MTNQKHSQQLLDKAEQIGIEVSRFIDECNKHLQNSKKLSEHFQYQIEEQMILKEESLVNKCESLAVLNLGNVFELKRGIVDDTRIVLKQIDEIRQASIHDEYSALHALRARFLGISFLPT